MPLLLGGAMVCPRRELAVARRGADGYRQEATAPGVGPLAGAVTRGGGGLGGAGPAASQPAHAAALTSRNPCRRHPTVAALGAIAIAATALAGSVLD